MHVSKSNSIVTLIPFHKNQLKSNLICIMLLKTNLHTQFQVNIGRQKSGKLKRNLLIDKGTNCEQTKRQASRGLIRNNGNCVTSGQYYNYDCSTGGHHDSIMADQLAGHWFLKASDLADNSVSIATNISQAAIHVIVPTAYGEKISRSFGV